MTLDRTDLSDAATLVAAIDRELDGLVVTEGGGDFYIFYDPDGVTQPESRFPFCTVVTGDQEYDSASDLDRDPSVYRLNVAVGAERYEALFGPAPRQPAGVGVIDTGYDYTAADTLLPHPLYAPMNWICVVNPGQHTLPDLDSSLAAAHAIACRVYHNQQRRRASH